MYARTHVPQARASGTHQVGAWCLLFWLLVIDRINPLYSGSFTVFVRQACRFLKCVPLHHSNSHSQRRNANVQYALCTTTCSKRGLPTHITALTTLHLSLKMVFACKLRLNSPKDRLPEAERGRAGRAPANDGVNARRSLFSVHALTSVVTAYSAFVSCLWERGPIVFSYNGIGKTFSPRGLRGLFSFRVVIAGTFTTYPAKRVVV